ncbi:MAG TPA: hypothetical protein EYG78_05585 [Sulfurovum sp.]|nr:hypothetical protein [Sulfurovum sp.]
MQKKRPLWHWLTPTLFLLLLTAIFSYEETKTFILTFFADLYLFIKHNIIAILTAFFLVKGKFVIKLFLRKVLILSATGLGKRYMIEHVLNHQIKVHFMDHLKEDFKRLLLHVKNNFQNFPLVKKIMTVFAFIGSLGFVGKFMGGMLAVKVFIAKIWSFLLAVFLKVFTALFYFITKVLWGSWVAPVLEIILFSWLLDWLNKIPFLKAGFRKLSEVFAYLFGWVEKSIAQLLKRPLRRFLKWMVKTMKIAIYKFIGYERVSLYQRLQESRKLHLNAYEVVKLKRRSREKQKEYSSAWQVLKEKRERRIPLRKIRI